MDELIKEMGNVGLLMGMGGISGASIAIYKGYSVPAATFSMSMNWGILGIPFFGLRSGMLAYRNSLNINQGIESFKRRDKDELLSSVFAGGTVGLCAGYIYKKRFGLMPGLFMFSGIAAIGQTIYTLSRHARIQLALKELDLSDQKVYSKSITEHIKSGSRFKNVLDGQELIPEKYDWDPVRDGFEAIVSMLGKVIDFPEWASPLVNALDSDYRKILNYKIKSLEDQISQLEEKRVKDSL